MAKATQAVPTTGMWDMTTTTVVAALSTVVTAAVTLNKAVQLAEREVDMLHHRQDLRMQSIQHELTVKADTLGLPKPKF